MSQQVTITLPDETFQRAARLAQLTSREVAEVLADTVELSLAPLGFPATEPDALDDLSDSALLDLSTSELEPEADKRLSQLLDAQQAGQLGTNEDELRALIQLYQNKWLLKARALEEAVRRGLREPLAP